MCKCAWIEIGITSTAFLLIVAYHIHLARKIRNAPLTTTIGLNNHLRRSWVRMIRREKKDILAVHTLRNWSMAASFLASSAILIALALVGAAFKSERIAEVTKTLNFVGSKSETYWLVKWMSLALVFFFTFFNFSLTIRHYNHISFIINIPAEIDPLVKSDRIMRILNHGTLHYIIGMRGYYLSIPLALWLFGPVWLLIGTVAMLAILYYLDRVV